MEIFKDLKNVQIEYKKNDKGGPRNIDDISMNGLFEFSDTQTRGNKKKTEKA